MVFGVLMLVVGVLLLFAGAVQLKAWRAGKALFRRQGDMTATAAGAITELREVQRRNRSFRWRDEIPVITYTVDGVRHEVELAAAEARAGTYTQGMPCTVRYVPSDPECCLIAEFEKQTKSAGKSALVAAVLLLFFGINCTLSAVGTLCAAFLG